MNVNKLITVSVLTLLVTYAKSQTATDLQAIKQLCGCFSVTFNYAETFTSDTSNRYYAKPRNHKAVTEYALPIEESPTKIVIQHLLVIPDGRGTIVKHWREDWEYEQNTWWEYTGVDEWTKVTVPKSQVKGQWLQTVWEVDDAPRYAGSSTWLSANDEVFWLNTTLAPLPRREFTKRDDYNIMERTNRIVVSEKGYVHEQDNKKVMRIPGKEDVIIAEEKGYNDYVRIGDAECAGADKSWTKEEAGFWSEVRNIWDKKMKSAQKIEMKKFIDSKAIYDWFGELQKQKLTGVEQAQAIEAIIDRYFKVIE